VAKQTSASAKSLNVHEAKSQFSRVLDRAHAGHETIISKKGKPWARIVPLAAPAKRELGFLAGVIVGEESLFEPLPEDELRLWEGR
jgi:prevent-host-death family protein